MSSSPYTETVYVNQVPYFDWTLMDTLRIGSFVAIQLRNQEDSKAITIARLEERQQDEDEDPDVAATTIRLRLFLPLFPTKRLSWHPKPPKHNHAKIQDGCGSMNEELYESTELRWISGEKPDEEIKVLFPTFVFTLEELKRTEHSWAQGMHNVYFARFWHHVIYSYVEKTKHQLDPLPTTVSMYFVNKHPSYKQPGNLIFQRRCRHQNIWVGLYRLRKFVLKIVKKQSESGVLDEDDLSLKIGHTPVECIQYIYTLANFMSDCDYHPVTLQESFQTTGLALSSNPIKLSYRGGVLRFGTHDDLSFVASLYGKRMTEAGSGKNDRKRDYHHLIFDLTQKENSEN